MFTTTAFASILPEILILIVGMLLLVVEPFWKEEQRRNVGWLTAGGLFLSMVISLMFGQPGEPTTTLGGTVRFDWLGFFFKMLFMFAGAYTLSRNGHVRGDFLYRTWQPRTQAKVDLVLYILFFFPGILALCIAGTLEADRAWMTWERSNSPATVPLAPFKTIIPIVGVPCSEQ